MLNISLNGLYHKNYNILEGEGASKHSIGCLGMMNSSSFECLEKYLMEYLVIVNPNAGVGRFKKVLGTLLSAFESKGATHRVEFTRSSGHAAQLAREGISSGVTHVISLGGDGTASEIASSVNGTDLILGIVPCGSGNDFPKAAGIPLNAREAVDNIFSGVSRKADVAFVDGKCFINGFGVGMDGAVAHAFGEMGLRNLGSLGYVIGALIESFRFRGFLCELDAASELSSVSEGKWLLFGASNGPFQGGKFNLAPKADIFDGYIDIHVINDMNPLYRLLKIPKVLKGKHDKMREVRILRSKRLLFETFIDLPAHMDGETFTLKAGKHEIRVAERSVNIIIPARGS